MKKFKDKIAVITGGGTGMGRELALQLVSEGCHIAICDVLTDNMSETRKLCEKIAPKETHITTHECDVSVEDQVIAFRDAVMRDHQTEHINLLFNNAGIGGGGSFIMDDRRAWERTFDISWFGVYYCSRAFLPMLIASSEGHLINTSSLNGFWACLGPTMPHTAYCTAKFAIKGFSEGLMVDLRLNAPHVKVSVVMPGHIGTELRRNLNKIQGTPSADEMTDAQLNMMRDRMKKWGNITDDISVNEFREMLSQRGDEFRDNAPISALEAATMILDAVRNEQWRVLVGKDAEILDQMVRDNPEDVYNPSFFDLFRNRLSS